MNCFSKKIDRQTQTEVISARGLANRSHGSVSVGHQHTVSIVRHTNGLAFTRNTKFRIPGLGGKRAVNAAL